MKLLDKNKAFVAVAVVAFATHPGTARAEDLAASSKRRSPSKNTNGRKRKLAFVTPRRNLDRGQGLCVRALPARRRRQRSCVRMVPVRRRLSRLS
jgi:hypothetical protein